MGHREESGVNVLVSKKSNKKKFKYCDDCSILSWKNRTGSTKEHSVYCILLPNYLLVVINLHSGLHKHYNTSTTSHIVQKSTLLRFCNREKQYNVFNKSFNEIVRRTNINREYGKLSDRNTPADVKPVISSHTEVGHLTEGGGCYFRVLLEIKVGDKSLEIGIFLFM